MRGGGPVGQGQRRAEPGFPSGGHLGRGLAVAARVGRGLEPASPRKAVLQTHARLVHRPLFLKERSFQGTTADDSPASLPELLWLWPRPGVGARAVADPSPCAPLRGCDPRRPPSTGCRLAVQATADPALDRPQSALHWPRSCPNGLLAQLVNLPMKLTVLFDQGRDHWFQLRQDLSRWLGRSTA